MEAKLLMASSEATRLGAQCARLESQLSDMQANSAAELAKMGQAVAEACSQRDAALASCEALSTKYEETCQVQEVRAALISHA